MLCKPSDNTQVNEQEETKPNTVIAIIYQDIMSLQLNGLH